jgi:choloylglycine hydrolase
MCTSIAFKTDDFYFGRNMDLDYNFGEKVVVMPRNYALEFRRAGRMKSHYAIIGMASVVNGYPLYAEGMNESGLSMAGLNFPDNAYYSPDEENGKYNISPFELIPWILGKCSTTDEAKKLLAATHIIALPFSENMPLATLHWHIADKNSSFVLEVMKDGMHIHDNPVNVMTNNPPFDFQITNLGQYLNLAVKLPDDNCFGKSADIKPFGKGLGSFGLPGDFSPASRFVKAAYLLLNSECNHDENSSISQFFHLLDSVAVVNGSIFSRVGYSYFTTYSCCMNVSKGIYYYKTYNNNQIAAVNMYNENLDSDSLREFELVRNQQIAFIN